MKKNKDWLSQTLYQNVFTNTVGLLWLLFLWISYGVLFTVDIFHLKNIWGLSWPSIIEGSFSSQYFSASVFLSQTAEPWQPATTH